MIVLYGNSMDTSARLSGIVVLSVSSPIRVKNIKLRLSGRSFVCWADESRHASPGNRIRRQVVQILDKSWSFLAPNESAKVIDQGNYEYPFYYELPPDIPDSIEGIPGCHIIYTLTASLERATQPPTNLETALQFRVIRTIPPNSLDLMHSVSVSDIWPLKVNYETSIPSKVYAIGSEIPVNITLYPLLKGLDVGKVTLVLKEYCTLFITSKAYSSTCRKEFKRALVKKTIPGLPMVDDYWQDQIMVKIPDSLGECTQDCDLNCIRVHHKLRLSISLLNPDGHVSELRNSLPLSLVISPVMFGARPTEGVFTGDHNSYVNENILPSYDKHVFDVLWDGIPSENPQLQSGFTTPNLSRRNSSDFGPNSPVNIHSNPVPISGQQPSSPASNSNANFFFGSSPQSMSSEQTDMMSPITSPLAPFSGVTRRAARTRANSASSVFNSQLQPLQTDLLSPLPSPTSSNSRLPRVRSACTLNVQELSKIPPYYEAHSAFTNVLPLDGLPRYEEATRPSSPTESVEIPSNTTTIAPSPVPTIIAPALPSTPAPPLPSHPMATRKSLSSTNLVRRGVR